MNDKTVHHLGANDFWLHEWQPIAQFPRDGSVVEIRDKEGKTGRAVWNVKARAIMIEPGGPEHPVEWHYM